MTDHAGQQVGNFHLIRLLEQGSIADLYLAAHVHNHVQVAVTIFHIPLADQAALENFYKEAHTLTLLAHPRIVRTLEYGVVATTPFLALDYMSGGTLRQRHPRGTQLPLTTIIPYVQQVAEALQYAHSQRVIHCAVRPEHMFIGPQGTILLGAFVPPSLIQHGLALGRSDSAISVAPELPGSPLLSSDQYALATAVYEWLSGAPPSRETDSDMMTPLRAFVRVSPEVEHVIMGALAQHPAQRFASVRDFALALEQAYRQEQTGTKASASNISTPESLYPPGVQQNHLPTWLPSSPIQLGAPLPDTMAAPPPVFPEPTPSTAPVLPQIGSYQSGYYTTWSADTPQHHTIQPSPYSMSPYDPDYALAQKAPYTANYTPPAPPPPAPMLTMTSGATSKTRQRPEPIFPLLRGKVQRKDLLWIGIYTALLFLATVPLFFTDGHLFTIFKILASESSLPSLYGFFWLLLIMPIGTILGGIILGTWRTLLGWCAFDLLVLISGTVQERALPPLQALALLGLTLAAASTGLLYERRRSSGCLGSGLALLLLSAIIAVSLMLFSPNHYKQPAVMIPIFLTLEVIFTFPSFILERGLGTIIRRIRMRKKSA